MAEQLHHRRVAAVRRAEDPDAAAVEVRTAAKRSYALRPVVDLGLPELEIERIERALAESWRSTRFELPEEEPVFGERAGHDEALAGDVAGELGRAVGADQ